jgi:Tfp pilus assembly protein PilN
MRPVNLIPAEERRGKHAPPRTGPLAYILVGALVAMLAGVTALVIVNNQISESEEELARVEREDAVAIAKASRLAAYTEFRDLSERRVSTVASLADSRFDWERVMQELALVLPNDVWLVSLTATAAPGVTIDGGGSSGNAAAMRASTPGPALEVIGCALGQEAVAGFVTSLQDIDGVTRVGVQSAELRQQEGGSAAETGANAAQDGDECRTNDFISKFEIVVAFDAAPIAAIGGSEPSSSTSETTSTSEEDEGEGSEEETGEAK